MDFYRIDEKYNAFLQEYEKKYRGVTKVPNIRYSDRNKFSFGAVLQVNNMNYYVSVSSFNKKQEANILIRVKGDKEEVKDNDMALDFLSKRLFECSDKITDELSKWKDTAV